MTGDRPDVTMPIAEPRPLIAMTLQALMTRSVLDKQGIDLIAIVRLTLGQATRRGAWRTSGVVDGTIAATTHCASTCRSCASSSPMDPTSRPRGRQIRRPRPRHRPAQRIPVRNRSLVDMAVDVTHGPPVSPPSVLNDRHRAKEKTE
jgi:hypothetical protein